MYHKNKYATEILNFSVIWDKNIIQICCQILLIPGLNLFNQNKLSDMKVHFKVSRHSLEPIHKKISMLLKSHLNLKWRVAYLPSLKQKHLCYSDRVSKCCRQADVHLFNIQLCMHNILRKKLQFICSIFYYYLCIFLPILFTLLFFI